MPFWPRQHLEMPITRMGNEVNAQRVKGNENERAGAGDEGGGRRAGDDGTRGLHRFYLNTGSYYYPEELPSELRGNGAAFHLSFVLTLYVFCTLLRNQPQLYVKNMQKNAAVLGYSNRVKAFMKLKGSSECEEACTN